MSAEFESPEEVAIVGMACRFPGARNIEEYWANLCDGVESISFLSLEESLSDGADPALLRAADYVGAAGVLDDIEMFDAEFFGVNPREARILDPQHRLFLECAWAALENAGYPPGAGSRSVGVFAGASANTYQMMVWSNPKLVRGMGRFQIGLLNSTDHLPTRVSYKLNLRGPSVNVQTACSTSLVAVHLACQSLLNGECDVALAGAVSVSVPQKVGYVYEEGGINSPDGHCRAFDARAQGTVGGNGVGVVVLKPASQALKDGDTIRAIIKSSAVNNDGSLKVGYTAPSLEGQAKVITEALTVARINPESISYVETHGTGTAFGDPIEIAALCEAFRGSTGKVGYCAVGSAKPNIGHLDAASGIAGLIKAALALEHKRIPPSLNVSEPNPRIGFQDTPFFVNSRIREWEAIEGPRRAGVSSFGIGGTNAHLILQEAEEVTSSTPSRRWKVFTVSATTDSALERAVANLRDNMIRRRDIDVADAAYTCNVGRRAFTHRRAFVCASNSDAVEAMRRSGFEGVLGKDTKPKPVAFLFPGQGSQHAGMGEQIYKSEPVFRDVFDFCANLLESHFGFDLRDLFSSSDRAKESPGKIFETCFGQPAIFAFEYALAKLWMSWGLRPAAMIGHSLGEYVAAALAGVFSLEDGLLLVARRGRLMQALEGGAMTAVSQPEEAARKLATDGLSLAAVNGPASCVMAGPLTAIVGLENSLAREGVAYRRLRTSHAFHSAMMHPVVAGFREVVQQVYLRRPEVPFVSCVSGSWITESEAVDPGYWARHIIETCRFGDGLSHLLQQDSLLMLEVGPGQALSSLARRQRKKAEQIIISSLSGGESGDEEKSLLEALAQIWASGADVDWQGFHQSEHLHRIPLPSYPFERQYFWADRPNTIAADTPSDRDGIEKEVVATTAANDSDPLVPSSDSVASAHGLSASGSVTSDAEASTGLDAADTPPVSPVDAILLQQLQIMSRQLSVIEEWSGDVGQGSSHE